MNSRVLAVLPPRDTPFSNSWPRVYRSCTGSKNLPVECYTYWLCIKPYGGSGDSVIMFRVAGGLHPEVYTFVNWIEEEVAKGKLERVKGIRIELELTDAE